MSAHTVGEWVVTDGRTITSFEALADVAVVQYSGDDEEDAANASLIAAAPDLLNALKVLADAAEAFGIPADAARAAISKATGEGNG